MCPPAKRKRLSPQHAGTSLECKDPAAGDVYDFRVSVNYSSDPMALKNGSTDENVSRGWSFTDADAASSHFIGLLRHASVTEVSLSGPLPIRLLQVSPVLQPLCETAMSRVCEAQKPGLCRSKVRTEFESESRKTKT